jgi:predicted phage-related endonuclease
MTTERLEITNRAQWLELRRKDVTASDIAVVCGVSQYKTIFQLWADKTNATPTTGERPDNGAMLRGRIYEPAVFKAALMFTDWLSVTPFDDKLYLRDPELRMGATPDAIGTDKDGEFIVQAKTVSRGAFETWEGPPLAYQLQTLTEAMLYGAPRAYLAVLVTDPYNPEFHHYEVPRHKDAEQRIRDAVAAFWNSIEAGEMPAIDYSRDAELIKQMFKPRDAVETIDLTGDNLLPAVLAERELLKADVKTAQARVDEIDAEIIHKLNGAQVGTCQGWKIFRKMTHRPEKLMPALSFPVMRITKQKEQSE